MPFTICTIHGENVAPHGCRHVAELILENKKPGQITHIDLDGVFFMGWVCPACLSTLNQKGLQTYLEKRRSNKDYPPADEIDPLIKDLDLQPVCPKCFEELTK
jgi:hypothetical protein